MPMSSGILNDSVSMSSTSLSVGLFGRSTRSAGPCCWLIRHGNHWIINAPGWWRPANGNVSIANVHALHEMKRKGRFSRERARERHGTETGSKWIVKSRLDSRPLADWRVMVHTLWDKHSDAAFICRSRWVACRWANWNESVILSVVANFNNYKSLSCS